MADRDGKRIGGVGRFGRLRQIQELGNHVLNLRLLCPSVTTDRGLDGERRVLGNLQTTRGCREHRNSANLAQLQCRLGVHGVEDVFDSDHLGMNVGNDLAKAFVDSIEPSWQRLSGGKTDGSAANYLQPGVASLLHDTVSGKFATAIDSENSHCGQCNRKVERSGIALTTLSREPASRGGFASNKQC